MVMPTCRQAFQVSQLHVARGINRGIGANANETVFG